VAKAGEKGGSSRLTTIFEREPMKSIHDCTPESSFRVRPLRIQHPNHGIGYIPFFSHHHNEFRGGSHTPGLGDKICELIGEALPISVASGRPSLTPTRRRALAMPTAILLYMMMKDGVYPLEENEPCFLYALIEFWL
jgi:hypothetical protein